MPCPIYIVNFFEDKIDLDLLRFSVCLYNDLSDFNCFRFISEFSSLKAILSLNLSNFFFLDFT